MSKVIRVPDISYLNLGLIMKFVYTGEATMAHNRLAGFLNHAKALGVCELPTDLRITQKPRSEVERKKKRVESKVNIASAKRKRDADDDLLTNDYKKRKLAESNDDWSEYSNSSQSVAFENRKRKPTAEEELIDEWDIGADRPQPIKRSRFTCQMCYQTFSDISALDHHVAFDCQDYNESSGSERFSDDDF